MMIFGKNKKDNELVTDRAEQVLEEDKMEKKDAEQSQMITPLQLFQNDVIILEKIEALQQKIEGIDKNNKKFLLAATMNDGRAEQLEKEIIGMKMGIISLLDQIDFLLSAVFSSEADNLKNALNSYYSKVVEIASGLGLEVINVVDNMKFDAKVMECREAVHLEEFEDDVVVEIVQRGYRDISTGNILRYAKVIVNKR